MELSSSLVVREGDDVMDGRVQVIVKKLAGKASTLTSTMLLTIDTIPPTKVIDLTAVDQPNDQGYAIRLTWQENQNPDFDHYRIYQSETPISPYSLEATKLLTTKAKSETIRVEQNNIDIYLAVTAVDIAGNVQQDLALVTAQAIDNIPPLPVQLILATDSPNDFGGQVSLVLRAPSFEPDFAGYRIYVSANEVMTTKGLRSILTVPDRNLISIDVLLSLIHISEPTRPY